WRYAHLSDLLGVDRHAAVSPWLLRVRAGTQRLALEVEGVRGRQEIVVKSAGPQVARLPGFVGATVLADGEVVFIVNPVLWSARPVRHRPLPETQKTELPGLVMVVDDSVTVRKVTSRLLEREGYRVATAKDGLDALEKLVDLMPQLILLDLEMPRMDGFELARALRADARLKDIPIIVISSRTAERHRALARELGIAHYLGKPYDETELLGLVGQHVGPVGHQTLV
ncbi:MAG TPA: response regulator, partial [Rhodocyclaceae bacterium]|nr:response regulator [Rhodocyclaceae bacterium]